MLDAFGKGASEDIRLAKQVLVIRAMRALTSAIVQLPAQRSLDIHAHEVGTVTASGTASRFAAGYTPRAGC